MEFHIWMYQYFLSYSTNSGHLGLFRYFTTINKASVNILVVVVAKSSFLRISFSRWNYCSKIPAEYKTFSTKRSSPHSPQTQARDSWSYQILRPNIIFGKKIFFPKLTVMK